MTMKEGNILFSPFSIQSALSMVIIKYYPSSFKRQITMPQSVFPKVYKLIIELKVTHKGPNIPISRVPQILICCRYRGVKTTKIIVPFPFKP